MARVLVLTADLLFGSRVQGDLAAAGHDVELVGDEARLRARLVSDGGSQRGDPGGSHEGDSAIDAPRAPDVLVVDLTDDRLDGADVLERLSTDRLLGSLRTLAYYSHVDAEARVRAERAGFHLVVPRSRMAREGAGVVRRLVG